MASSVPTTQAAVIIEKTGGRDVLQYKTDVPVPTPQEGQLLVKNEFIGINYIDTYFRSGLYPIPKFPHILGQEAAGTVVSVPTPNPHGFSIGQRVAFNGAATYAEYSAVAASVAVAVPDSVSSEDAAGAPLQALTAWTMLKGSHEVKKGETILVTAAAGGVGLWLVQLGKLLGARVIATASSSKLELVKSVGADLVIDYSSGEFLDGVLKATEGEGVHAVFDGVGKDTFEQSLKSVRRNGTLVSFGNASGAVPPFSILRLGEKNVKLLRPRLFNYIATREELETNYNDIWNFISKGGIKVRIHEIYPLKDAARAHEDLEGRKTTGKLLLKP